MQFATFLLHNRSAAYAFFYSQTPEFHWTHQWYWLEGVSCQFFSPFCSLHMILCILITYDCVKINVPLLYKWFFTHLNRYHRAKPVIIDPGLYSVNKSDVFWVSQKRNVPTAYKLFTGEKHYFTFLLPVQIFSSFKFESF